MSQVTPIRTASERDGALHRIVLDRPRGNILDLDMVTALRAEIRRLATRPTSPSPLKLIVFEGAGPNFSFGASVDEHLPEPMMKFLPAFHAFFEELERLGVPTAALVRGQCLGGGMELAAVSGRVICEPSAVFGLPEIQLGVFPPIAALLLHWRVGGSRATDLVLSGETVGGEEAVRLGIADACVPDAEAELQRWFSAQLAPKSAVAVGFAWRAARQPIRRALTDDLPVLERMYLKDLMSYVDPEEGVRAFLEKRKPVWRDR